MTPQAIADLRVLVGKATATTGPWFIGRLQSYRGDTGSPFRCVYRGKGETAETRITVGGGDGEQGAEFDCDADAALIVALVNAAPALLDTAERVRRLEEALGQACAHLEHAGAWVSAKVFRALLTDPTTNIHNAAQSGGE